MLHALKRSTVGLSAAKHEPVNTEFENLKTNLDNVQKSLSTALSEIDGAQKAYKKAATDAGKFSTTLFNLYPNDDDTRVLFKTTLDQVVDVVPKDLEEAIEPTSQVRSLERVVSAYLTEIKSLAEEYPKLDTARRDYAMYQAKVDKLGKKDSDSDKQSRNMGKLEDSKAKYNSLLEGTLHRMKKTYEKAAIMFRASYIAYWIYQNSVHDILGKHFGPAMSYARLHADAVLLESGTASAPPSPTPPSPTE
ncbi:hypothetical protein BWQ96_02131 [Gracilariopsis chorda]|uniref:BAR domain-containing protein n=1 Tax=Gracilariopsis chorda TaxID=448386 RepID=A0A2V3J1F9_9FLOR|nr:hypothetical protein BWQ96_02131 [Gracilariopsis chorda]|eukprot:PXF48179.1 hypothetical protein BWQ96_02131 [Gracilariopsis chorda]